MSPDVPPYHFYKVSQDAAAAAAVDIFVLGRVNLSPQQLGLAGRGVDPFPRRSSSWCVTWRGANPIPIPSSWAYMCCLGPGPGPGPGYLRQTSKKPPPGKKCIPYILKCVILRVSVTSYASNFCTKRRAVQLPIFGLGLISVVITGLLEPWPECQPKATTSQRRRSCLR